MDAHPNIHLSDAALLVLSTLENAGYTAWCVGGCVRDALLNRPCHDVDIATSAHWQQTRDVCIAAGMKTFETGIKHGTLSVVCNDEVFEVTTYRNDGTYSDSRHPDKVTFVDSIDEDLARRDFTINAMAWHPQRGLYDPFGGADDVNNQMIRAVGNPRERFEEDALRVLRAVRFASQLDFAIEDNTLTGMNYAAQGLTSIAVERIYAELEALLCGKNPYRVLMDYNDILAVCMPELVPMKNFDQHTPYHIYDVLEHTAFVVQNTPPYPLARWVALFHDMGKPETFFTDEDGTGHFYGHPKVSKEIAHAIMHRLKMPSKFMHDVELLVLHHDEVIEARPKPVKRMMQRLEGREDLFRCLCDIKRADALSQAPQCIGRVQLANDLDDCLTRIIEEQQAFCIRDLAIDGNDLMKEGMKAGPDIGTALKAALDAVIEESIPNNRDACLTFLRGNGYLPS